MTPADDHGWLYDLAPGEGDASRLVAVAERLVERGALAPAATAYDRAHGVDPTDEAVATARARLLSALAVDAHGLRFRYVPAGCYAMGSADGDPDERPVHLVRLSAFWLTDAPISWATYCALMRWEPPPSGRPTSLRGDEQTDDEEFDPAEFMLAEANKIRLQYCEDGALAAADWHGHAGVLAGMVAPPPRDDPRGPVTYERKPMVAVAWQEAEQLANRLSDEGVTYRLPTEAEWEAAARGGLVGRRYPWGDEPPTPEVCDFGRFDEFAIGPTRRRPPNGYGLHGMSGGVWEWTADWYDAEYYAESPADDPTGPPTGLERCLRGGSWADCAEVATVSFRTSRPATPWWEGEWGKQLTPNIGFRLCRVEDR